MRPENEEHGLRIQLATALRELEDARGEAAMYKQRYFEKGADSQQWAARAGETDAALAAANARAGAQMAAVLHTIGGEVDGHPTSAIDYLQRLRALVAIEKAFADAGPMVESAKYMVEKARDCERAESALAAARRESTLYRGVIDNLLSVMEMQEKRESGAFHITGEVMFGIWSDAKEQAREALSAPAAAAGEEGTR